MTVTDTGNNTHRRLAVAMSGGVDSSVTAALMLEKGYEVFGVYMRNWRDDDRTPECTAIRDWTDARRACDKLGINLEVVEFSHIYKQKVFAPFLDELRQGRTPNPDVMCNHHIKFRALTEHVKTLGADAMATGHYARLIPTADGQHLYCARDKNKCQTYFLFAAASFDNCLMPLGEMQKQEVRALARKFGLHNHSKKDSTGLCFIGERDFNKFISRYLPDEPGEIRDTAGNFLGMHRGLFHHTLGQRRGLGIGGTRAQTDGMHDMRTEATRMQDVRPHPGEAGGVGEVGAAGEVAKVSDSDASDRAGGSGSLNEAWYVVDKIPQQNILVVARGGNNPRLYATAALLAKPVWIGEPLPLPAACDVKTRYRMASAPCRLSPTEGEQGEQGKVLLQFATPQRAITPGQAAVFYTGERCRGGAIIERALTAETETTKARSAQKPKETVKETV